MSDALKGATQGMPAGQSSVHPVAAIGQQAAHSVAKFIQAVRAMPNVDHKKIDAGVSLLQQAMKEILDGVKKKSE